MSFRTRSIVRGICCVVAGGAMSVGAVHAAAQRTYTGGHEVLQVNGQNVVVKALGGGDMVGQVVEETNAGPGYVKKHIGGVAIDPIEATIPPYELGKFLQDQLSGKPGGANGAIQYGDFNYKLTKQVDFTNALLTRLEVPALDGSSKDACYLGITLQPETVRTDKSTGSDMHNTLGTKQKSAMCSNFHVTLGTLPCNRVAKVEAITIQRKSTPDSIGSQRDIGKTPQGPWQVSNIVLHVSAADEQAFYQWHNDFVVQGKNDDGQEKTMTIELLGPDMKSVLQTLQFDNVGIVSVQREGGEPGNEQIQRIRVELYAERASLGGGGGGATDSAAAASTSTPPASDTPPADARAATPSDVKAVPTTQAKKRRAVKPQ